MARTLQSILDSVPAAIRRKLDQEIDFDHRNPRGKMIPEDLGRISESMAEWDGAVADCLGLTDTERRDIRDGYPNNPNQQRREALSKWKDNLGKEATYRALIEVFFKAGKVNYADAVCDLFKDPSDLPGDTQDATGGHIGFSPSMGPDSLAQWLRQEYGSDYPEDVEKLCKAKINGKQLLNNISMMISKLNLSFGFQMEIEERAKILKEPAATSVPPPPAGSSPHTSPTQQTQPSAKLSHQSLYNQLKPHGSKWKEIGTNLGFRQTELTDIESRPPLFMGAPSSWLSAMLTEYLEWEPGDDRGTQECPSLESLKSAVSKAGLGRSAAQLHY